MGNNSERKQSIDDFYKDKIESGQLDFDINGWDELESRLDSDAQKSSISVIISHWKARWVPILLFMVLAASSVSLMMYLDDSGIVSSDSENIQMMEKNRKTYFSANKKLSEGLTATEMNAVSTKPELDEEAGINEFQSGKKLTFETSERIDKSRPAQGGGIKSLKNGQTVRYDVGSIPSKNGEENSHQNTNYDSNTYTTLPSATSTSSIGENQSTPAMTDEDNLANEDPIHGQEYFLSDNAQTKKMFNEGVLIKDDNAIYNSSIRDAGNKKEAESTFADSRSNQDLTDFPFLPLRQIELVRNEFVELNDEFLSPSKVEIQTRSSKTAYIRAGYVEALDSYFNNGSPNIMAAIGHDFIIRNHGGCGLELIYERIRNVRKTAVYINDLNIKAERNREAINLVTSFRWKPNQGRFSMSSFAGLGVERTSWDLESTLFYPFSTVEAAQNSNRIHMKLSPFASIGGDIGFDIIKNSLSFHISANYQYRLSDVTINGSLQGYKINPSENEEAYDIIEERILRNNNFTSIYIGLKYYIF